MEQRKTTRRVFLMGTALTVAGCATSRKRVRISSPNEKLNTAHIGVGGKGRGHLEHCYKNETVVAMCDVDDVSAAESYDKYLKPNRYRDFRVMLEKEKSIDAVVVATPDNTHAVAAMAAMQLGKHVYVEKPLAYCVSEVRMLTKAARKYNVATQMGNQGHSMDCARQVCEMIWTGAIGNVREAHCWTDRPIWPQGIPGPLPSMPVPDTLDWDLWLGPAAERPYNKGYLPDNWRGWWDFGGGALGDMGCHNMDPANWALHLGAPSSVECVTQEGSNPQTYPTKSIIKYEFPERKWEGKTFVPVTFYWYDGKLLPPSPKGLPESVKIGEGSNGTLFIGDEGCLTCGVYGGDARLLPETRMKDYTMPDPFLERIPNEDHRDNWLRACKGGKPACSNFDYAGPLAEMVLLGNVALRIGQRIEWDSRKMKVTNIPEANRFVTRRYRDGWEL
ncbi:MAG: Gfo/Idh/MocA family oxidoreductase [bacterium]